MVVRSTPSSGDRGGSVPIDLAYLGFLLGLRVNEMVREHGKAHGHHGMRDSYGFVIQHLIESDRSITELARRMDVSQQAASKFIADLVRRGIVESHVSDDRRTRRVRLSTRGWALVRFTRNARHAIDTRLQRTVGAKDYDNARKTLLACLESLGGLARVRTRRVKSPPEMRPAPDKSR